jgi:glycine/D-amino acid oxidase-like deaminating enzyme
MPAHETDVVVLGAGILGCLTALQCARRGRHVVVVEREPAPWSRASLHNEGKVHLGLVYALGTEQTRTALLADALRFAPDVESAVGHPIDWASLRTASFQYIVMPDSLADAQTLATRYHELDDHYRALGSPPYLGERLEQLVDATPRPDPISGMPSFSTAERALDLTALRALVLDALTASTTITVRTGVAVSQVTPTETPSSNDAHRLTVRTTDGTFSVTGRAVIDCRWEEQGAGIPTRPVAPRNLRVKAAVRVRTRQPVVTATLVAGPFGDVVQHRDHAYVSWYPAARLHHALTDFPDGAAQDALERVTDPSVIARQLAALQGLGWVPHDAEVIEGVGGFIVGDGAVDIDSRRSLLHDRAAAGVEVHGRTVLPRSLKLSSAPAAAVAAAEAAAALVGRRTAAEVAGG